MVQSATNGAAPTDSRCQVWVGNLPYRVRWQDLKDLMRKAGVVLRSEVALTVDSRSRGYGTVLFARREDAFKAIQIYNGFQWMTRTLEVHIDAGDPQGVIAISEANRQTALQQQAQHYQLAAMQQQQYAPPPQSQYRPGPPQAQIPPMQSFPAPYPSSTTTVPPSTSSTSSHSTPDPASPITPPSTLPPRSIASSDSSSDTRPSTNYASTQTHQTDEAERQLVANHQFASMIATLTMQMGGSGPPNSNGPPLPPNFGMMQPPPPPPPGAMNELIPFFLQQQQSMQLQRPPPPSQSNSYAPVFSNRHLFVGNLPFNCQWQELKDLMRAAGAVLRAEVAQADGRSRGFGSVLFESAESSQRAVAMFNGYDYNGRLLKVHFDKFSQTAPSGAAPNNLSSLMPSSIPPPPMQMQQQPFIPPPPFSLHFPPASAFASIPPPGGFADRREDSTTSTDLSQTPIAPTTNPKAPLGRISMPPPYPFPGGPMSPLQSRMMAQLPLMTPSMPAFTLGAFPSTPPLYPQMFSPGLGTFSPGLMRPGMIDSGYGMVDGGNFIMNPAPGAPLHRGQSYHHYQTSIHPMLSPGVSQYPHPPQVQYDAPTPRGNPVSDTSRRGSQEEHGYFPIVDDPANAALLNPTSMDDGTNGRGSASAPGTTFPSPDLLKRRSDFPSPPLLISSRSDGQLDSALSTSALHSILPPLPLRTDEESSSHGDTNEEEDEGAEATAQSIAFFSSDPIALARRKSSLGNEKEPRLLDIRRASYEGAGSRTAPKFGSSIWGGDV